jgi:chromosome segregation ATPase
MLRAREAEAVKASARAQFFAASASELASITASAAAEESALIEQLTAVEKRLQQVAFDLAGAKRTLGSTHAQLEEQKTYRTTLETGLKRPGSPEAVTAILTTINELEAAIISLASQKAAAHTQLETLTPMLADLEQRRADLTARIDKLADVRQRAETDLAAARLKHMTELSRAIEQRWATPLQEQEPAPSVAPLPAVINSPVDSGQSRVH